MKSCKRGDVVKHPIHGLGRVAYVCASGPESKPPGDRVTVAFDNGVRQTFVLEYAPLTVLTLEERTESNLPRPKKTFEGGLDAGGAAPVSAAGNYRTTGRIKGSINALCPFITFDASGATFQQIRGRSHKTSPGLFVFSEPGHLIEHGLIIPVSRCRDKKLKEALIDLSVELLNTDPHEKAELRRKAGERLAEVGVQVETGSNTYFPLELQKDKGLFSLLSQFDYVEAFWDVPGGKARPASYKPFSWRTYGEFLEWYNGEANDRNYAWIAPQPRLVIETTDNTVRDWETNNRIQRPAENISKFFILRPEVKDEAVAVSLKMEKYGWAGLNIAAGTKNVDIACSSAYCPFRNILKWLKLAHFGEIPVELTINEEGSEKKLSILATGDKERVLFRITDAFAPDRLFVEAVVGRGQLVEAFRSELLRFFKTEFAPKHWSDPHQEKCTLKKKILADPWLTQE